eukprot:8588654-Prorocentrum_lima.AAC.1
MDRVKQTHKRKQLLHIPGAFPEATPGMAPEFIQVPEAQPGTAPGIQPGEAAPSPLPPRGE